MYIIAKKKDYYDGVAGTTGIDKTIVYDRETLEFEKDDIPTMFERKRGYWSTRKADTPFHKIGYHSIRKEFRGVFCDEYAYFIIGFCGKLYVGWKLYRANNEYPYEVTTEITYDFDFMKTFLEQKTWQGNLEDSVNYVKTYDALQMFRDLKSPIFVYDSDFGRLYFDKKRSIYNSHKSKFFINSLLKDYEFYKIFDSFQAFQEVSMFMGGVLGRGEKEIVEVADKYKIAQHGFDKWSFRKEPENKK
jgi:hypothetical protein